MHSVHTLIIDLTLITVYAALITLLFKKLKQPTVLGYILAGILAGPSFNFLPTVTANENLTLWADIGVIPERDRSFPIYGSPAYEVA